MLNYLKMSNCSSNITKPVCRCLIFQRKCSPHQVQRSQTDGVGLSSTAGRVPEVSCAPLDSSQHRDPNQEHFLVFASYLDELILTYFNNQPAWYQNESVRAAEAV